MVRALLALLALVLGGCACVLQADRPGQEEAGRLVWGDYFKADLCLMPDVVWEDTEGCLSVSQPRECDAGLYYTQTDTAYVAWHVGKRISDTAYAHELMHAYQWTNGIYDPKHLRPEWAEIPRIDAALRARGL